MPSAGALLETTAGSPDAPVTPLGDASSAPVSYAAQRPDCRASCIPIVTTPASEQLDAVNCLLQRLLPCGAWRVFNLGLPDAVAWAPYGYFRVGPVESGRVHVQGSSGVELAAGVHWFLKHWVHSSVSWAATGGVQVAPGALDAAALAVLEGRAVDEVRRCAPLSVYQNVVTVSYSSAFWEWPRWEAEVDWMALQGINLPLMPVGIEAIWAETFTEDFGLAPSELEGFFAGPAFLAWGRMGNLQGYMGPLPPAYMTKQRDLGARLAARMRAFGMTPVLPAFAGFVPTALVERHPGARARRAGPWAHFPSALTSPLLLEPEDPLFRSVGAAFVARMRAAYGADARGYYIADTFNEMAPGSGDTAYLASVAASVYAAMAAADHGGVWLMQAWLFFSDQAFWSAQRIQALLSGVAPGRLVLLDLFAEEHPIWLRTACFYGYPWVWCCLHNFGGNLGMYGALESATSGLIAARTAAPRNLVGVGIVPEGLEQNPVVYEMMAEAAFEMRAVGSDSCAPGLGPAGGPGGLCDVAAWLGAYAGRRYGGAGCMPAPAAAALKRAWALLGRSAYAAHDRARSTVCDIPTSRPGLSHSEIVGWGLRPHLYYLLADLAGAWDALLAAAAAAPALATCSSFTYDLLDVSRELLSKLSGEYWHQAVRAFTERDLQSLRAAGSRLLAVLADMDAMLGAHAGFLLGPRLAQAVAYASLASAGGESEQPRTSTPGARTRPKATRDDLAALYERNLRTQLTIWGTSDAAGDSEVSDYANKEWSGLLASFYAPRWRMWLERLDTALSGGAPYDPEAWRCECLAFTHTWTQRRDWDSFATVPRGDAVMLSRAAFTEYVPAVLVTPPAAQVLAAAMAAAAAAAGNANTTGMSVAPVLLPALAGMPGAAMAASAAAAVAGAVVVEAAAAMEAATGQEGASCVVPEVAAA